LLTRVLCAADASVRDGLMLGISELAHNKRNNEVRPENALISNEICWVG
jgi:hypothetical protein